MSTQSSLPVLRVAPSHPGLSAPIIAYFLERGGQWWEKHGRCRLYLKMWRQDGHDHAPYIDATNSTIVWPMIHRNATRDQIRATLEWEEKAETWLSEQILNVSHAQHRGLLPTRDKS